MGSKKSWGKLVGKGGSKKASASGPSAAELERQKAEASTAGQSGGEGDNNAFADGILAQLNKKKRGETVIGMGNQTFTSTLGA